MKEWEEEGFVPDPVLPVGPAALPQSMGSQSARRTRGALRVRTTCYLQDTLCFFVYLDFQLVQLIIDSFAFDCNCGKGLCYKNISIEKAVCKLYKTYLLDFFVCSAIRKPQKALCASAGYKEA